MTDQEVNQRAGLLFSVKPRWSGKLLDGTKTVEFRRRGPGQAAIGRPILLYESAPLSELVGYGSILEILRAEPSELWQRYSEQGGIEEDGFRAYFAGAALGDALVVKCSRLPHSLKLDLLRTRYNWRPPMSWSWLAATSPLLDLLPGRRI
jgi:predicted transcriptional regulator